jgi:hypothetical protein
MVLLFANPFAEERDAYVLPERILQQHLVSS